MPNMANMVNKHNARLVREKDQNHTTRSCNCRNRDSCLLHGNCLIQCSVYKASVIDRNSHSEYVGTFEGPFKDRFNNHTKSFRNRKYESDTELSKLIWALKDKGENPTVKWSVAATTSAYNSGSRKCDLCLSEKLLIALHHGYKLINKRSKILNKCRHTNKLLLKNFKIRLK